MLMESWWTLGEDVLNETVSESNVLEVTIPAILSGKNQRGRNSSVQQTVTIMEKGIVSFTLF